MAVLSRYNDLDLTGIPKQYQQNRTYEQENSQYEYYRQ